MYVYRVKLTWLSDTARRARRPDVTWKALLAEIRQEGAGGIFGTMFATAFMDEDAQEKALEKVKKHRSEWEGIVLTRDATGAGAVREAVVLAFGRAPGGVLNNRALAVRAPLVEMVGEVANYSLMMGRWG